MDQGAHSDQSEHILDKFTSLRAKQRDLADTVVDLIDPAHNVDDFERSLKSVGFALRAFRGDWLKLQRAGCFVYLLAHDRRTLVTVGELNYSHVGFFRRGDIELYKSAVHTARSWTKHYSEILGCFQSSDGLPKFVNENLDLLVARLKLSNALYQCYERQFVSFTSNAKGPSIFSHEFRSAARQSTASSLEALLGSSTEPGSIHHEIRRIKVTPLLDYRSLQALLSNSLQTKQSSESMISLATPFTTISDATGKACASRINAVCKQIIEETKLPAFELDSIPQDDYGFRLRFLGLLTTYQ